MESTDVSESAGQSATENLLVLAPPVGTDLAAVAGGVLAGTHDACLLVVSLSGAGSGFVDEAVDHSGTAPARVAVASTAEHTARTEVPIDRHVTLTDPSDLTGLGIRIDQCFEAWNDDDHVVLAFDSLTTLVQFAPLPTVFRFCHAITRKASSRGVRTVFGLDPTAVDERTTRTLESLFDRVVDRR